jgi:hypothetical protein
MVDKVVVKAGTGARTSGTPIKARLFLRYNRFADIVICADARDLIGNEGTSPTWR